MSSSTVFFSLFQIYSFPLLSQAILCYTTNISLTLLPKAVGFNSGSYRVLPWCNLFIMVTRANELSNLCLRSRDMCLKILCVLKKMAFFFFVCYKISSWRGAALNSNSSRDLKVFLGYRVGIAILKIELFRFEFASSKENSDLNTCWFFHQKKIKII